MVVNVLQEGLVHGAKACEAQRDIDRARGLLPFPSDRAYYLRYLIFITGEHGSRPSVPFKRPIIKLKVALTSYIFGSQSKHQQRVSP
jgi:hypothetical protein